MVDNPSFDAAEQLAMKYNLSIDQCHHSYLEYLLTSSTLSLIDIRQRIKPIFTSERLKKNRQVKLDLVKRLHNNVWPLIAGRDLPRLKLFYELKKLLGDVTHAQKHLQVIEELPRCLPLGFDYKEFLSTPESFIEKFVTEENLLSFATIVDRVKLSSSLVITSNEVIALFLRRHASTVRLAFVVELLDRIESKDECRSLLEDLLPRRSIDERLQLLQQINFDSFEERIQRLKIFKEYHLEQLDLTETNEEREEIIADIVAQRGDLSLLLFCKTKIFPDLSQQRILRSIIEKINEQISLNSVKRNTNTADEERLLTRLEDLGWDQIDREDLLPSLQEMSRRETLDRRVRFQLIKQLNRVKHLFSSFSPHSRHSDLRQRLSSSR